MAGRLSPERSSEPHWLFAFDKCGWFIMQQNPKIYKCPHWCDIAPDDRELPKWVKYPPEIKQHQSIGWFLKWVAERGDEG